MAGFDYFLLVSYGYFKSNSKFISLLNYHLDRHLKKVYQMILSFEIIFIKNYISTKY